jgi:hypothetical protein
MFQVFFGAIYFPQVDKRFGSEYRPTTKIHPSPERNSYSASQCLYISTFDEMRTFLIEAFKLLGPM